MSRNRRYAVVGGPTDSICIFRLPDPPAARDRRGSAYPGPWKPPWGRV